MYNIPSNTKHWEGRKSNIQDEKTVIETNKKSQKGQIQQKNFPTSVMNVLIT